MIDTKVLTHLEKYFKLSRDKYTEGDYALAAFFAITAIEEAAKLIVLRDSSSTQEKNTQTRDFFSHDAKYAIAIYNLLDFSPQRDTFPEKWIDEIFSWIGPHRRTTKLKKIRNACLYLSDRKGQILTPEQVINMEQAGLLAYMAGVALANLDDYIYGIPPDWKESIKQEAEDFRSQSLRE